MGYMHTWKLSRAFTEIEWLTLTVVAQALAMNLPKFSHSAGGFYSEHPLQISDFDVGAPGFEDSLIVFNGAGPDLAHDTFVLQQQPDGFEFCKTARKPYDLLVVAVLRAAYLIAPDAIEISSDGNTDDLAPGWRFAAKTMYLRNFSPSPLARHGLGEQQGPGWEYFA
ncbi:MAG: hypothetical protein EVA65_15795 [Oceanococcus sp.]|nr:MAG: hypothetical protein EVA65_15795 [Oceanococcus sp.]